jgi:isoleucyl-tRNA synthetase
MDAARDVCSAALSLRKARGLRVRQPVPSLTAALPEAERLRPFDDVSAYSQQVLTVVPRALGPRIGSAVQQVIRAVKAGEWELVDGAPVAAGVTLQEGEYELRMVAADAEHTAPLAGRDGVVVLDTNVTPELAAEGLARDVVRVVQQARREAGLNVSDRITLVVEAPDEVADAVRTHESFVAGEVLAEAVSYGEAGQGAFTGEAGDALPVKVAVTRAGT